MKGLKAMIHIPGESKKVYALGGQWNEKYVTDILKMMLISQ